MIDLKAFRKTKLTGHLRRPWLWAPWPSMVSIPESLAKTLKEVLFHSVTLFFMTKRRVRHACRFVTLVLWKITQRAGYKITTPTYANWALWLSSMVTVWSLLAIFAFGKHNLVTSTILLNLLSISISCVQKRSGWDSQVWFCCCHTGSTERVLNIRHATLSGSSKILTHKLMTVEVHMTL